MSLHAELTPEAKARLAVQKRNSTISSIIISLLLVLLVGIILTLLFLPRIENFTPEIVSYQSPQNQEKKVVKKEINRQVQKKPSSPSSSMAKVIASNVVADVAVPVPDTPVDIPLNFGDGDGFGDGWGNGDGWGSGGGGATFFGQKVKAQRVVYVIDYSASMRGSRINLLKDELTKSLKTMSAGTEYQLIFFAGPAWFAGDKVTLADDRSGAVVESDGREYKWSCTNVHNWSTKGRRQKASWLKASFEQLEESEKAVQSTPLVWGTAWEDPLKMALDMKPKPDVIFFMTDGSAGARSTKVAKEIGAKAKSRKIRLNSIAMMDPRAAEGMKTLADASGGTFTMIDRDGKVRRGKVK